MFRCLVRSLRLHRQHLARNRSRSGRYSHHLVSFASNVLACCRCSFCARPAHVRCLLPCWVQTSTICLVVTWTSSRTTVTLLSRASIASLSSYARHRKVCAAPPTTWTWYLISYLCLIPSRHQGQPLSMEYIVELLLCPACACLRPIHMRCARLCKHTSGMSFCRRLASRRRPLRLPLTRPYGSSTQP